MVTRAFGVITRHCICKAIDRAEACSLYSWPYTSLALTRYFRHNFIISPLSTAAYTDIATMPGDHLSPLELSIHRSLAVYDRLLQMTYEKADNNSYFPVLRQLVLHGQVERACHLLNTRMILGDLNTEQSLSLLHCVEGYLMSQESSIRFGVHADAVDAVTTARSIGVQMLVLFAQLYIPDYASSLRTTPLLTEIDKETIRQARQNITNK